MGWLYSSNVERSNNHIRLFLCLFLNEKANLYAYVRFEKYAYYLCDLLLMNATRFILFWLTFVGCHVFVGHPNANDFEIHNFK
jgi:hypothetical protein